MVSSEGPYSRGEAINLCGYLLLVFFREFNEMVIFRPN